MKMSENEKKYPLRDEEIDCLRGIVMDSVAAEFYQPLNTIALNKDYLRMHLEHQQGHYSQLKVNQALDGIDCAAAQLNRLMNNCCDLMSCLQNRSCPQKEAVDLWSVIDSIAAGSKEAAGILGIDLVTDNPQKTLIVETDPYMAERIILNLLSNAMRVSPAGYTMLIAMQETETGCSFSISDGGRGVSPEYAKDAFRVKPFDTELDRERYLGGNGLGVYLVGELCRLLGWKPSIRAEKRGNITTVNIPMEQMTTEHRLVFHSADAEKEAERLYLEDITRRELSCLPGLEEWKKE